MLSISIEAVIGITFCYLLGSIAVSTHINCLKKELKEKDKKYNNLKAAYPVAGYDAKTDTNYIFSNCIEMRHG